MKRADARPGRLEVYPDPLALGAAVAQWLTEQVERTPSPVRICLSGGGTPKALYRLLASDGFRADFPWGRVLWFWGDERFVPYDDPESNYGMARDAMLSKIPVPPDQIFPIPVDGTPAEAAERYEATLQRSYGAVTLEPSRPLFHVTLLGLGEDGHCASLLPGTPVLKERVRWAAPVTRGRPEARVTLTYPSLEASSAVAFLVTGSAKATILRQVRSGASDVPAARLNPWGELIWFADREAAGP